LVAGSSFAEKIVSMNGWTITPGRKDEAITLKNAVETSLAPDTLYTDAKTRILTVRQVEVGSVVGFEMQMKCSPPSLEDVFWISEQFPVRLARYRLQLPAGWSCTPYWINHPAPPEQPGPAAGDRTWELSDLPALAEEECQPDAPALAARLIVRFQPAAPDSRCFADWGALAAWYDRLTRERRTADPALAEKVHALTDGKTGLLSRLQALAAFAQREVRYVSIQIGMGGYQPHFAGEICSHRYGDCKDKATLLLAMLRETGVTSHYILIHSSRGAVTPHSPPSLSLFNHVILAISLPEDLPDPGWPAVFSHPRYGRLLVFDPTAACTPLGRLPSYLQGNTGLLVGDDGGELLQLPQPAAQENRLERSGRMILSEDGTLRGEIIEVRRGSMADSHRYALLTSDIQERTRFLESFLGNSLGGTLNGSTIENLDQFDKDMIITYRFTAPDYAKKSGSYLILRPRIVGSKGENLESREEKPRTSPIDLDTVCLQSDRFVIELPEGCAIEQLPPPVMLEPGFATYRSCVETGGRTLTYTREYRVTQPVLPADRIAEAIAFYRAVEGDERQNILIKK
jgi:transglutaminase-like putative cysteine protease